MAEQVSDLISDVPQKYLAEWQEILDTTASLTGIPACLIMKVNGPDIEVYVSSKTEENPYKVGDREPLWGTSLYCETVIKTQKKLLVPNALVDEDWKNSPDAKLNMISYLGYPITLPDGKPFGTICVLDNKENHYSETYTEFLAKMRDLVQSHLALIFMNRALKEKNQELSDHIAEIKTLRGIIPICAQCKKIRDDSQYWQSVEKYLSEHTEARFSHSICPDCARELYPDLDS